MPEVGLEPTPPKGHDFESCASTDSATPARSEYKAKHRIHKERIFLYFCRERTCYDGVMSPEKPCIIAVVGPTATGKTNVAIMLAEELNGEIISADSRQVYCGLDIGTDKISEEKKRGIPHHLIDVADTTEHFTAADFRDAARDAATEIQKREHLPIIAGGTGFYIDAFVGRIHFPDVPPNPELRTKLEQKTTGELFEKLRTKAPERAQTIDPHNKRRLVRALEIYDALGYIPTAENTEQYEVCWIGLDRDDAELYERIQKRAREQLTGGLLDEINTLEQKALPEERWQEFGFEYTVGRKHHHGELSLEEAVRELTEQNWQYARRQRTYFRANTDIAWFHPDSHKNIKAYAKRYCQKA